MKGLCPECDGAIEIPDELLASGGTKVRCGGCQTKLIMTVRGDLIPLPPGAMGPGVSSRGGSSSAGSVPSSAPPSGSAGMGGSGSVGLNFSTPTPGLYGSGSGAVPSSGSGSGGGAAFPPLNDGDVVKGKWRIEGEIGRGATAVVYRARDLHTDLEVALKVVGVVGQEAPRELVRNLGDEYKVRREISDSRHVLTIESPDVEVRSTGVTYVVLPMELAAKTFRQWLEETAEDVEGRQAEGLELFMQACRGVAALHAAGITHLDLKPENLLLVAHRSASRKGRTEAQPQWTMKVGDFGLAKAGAGVRLLPVAGEGVGTPRYMAPEQVRSARSKDIGPSADVYALGCILFELLDGEPPFDGRTSKEVRDKHLDLSPPRLSGVDGLLSELVMRSLKKDRLERPANALELLDLLASNPAEETAYAEAVKANTEMAWTAFIKKWGGGRYNVVAKEALERLLALPEIKIKEAKEAATIAITEKRNTDKKPARFSPTYMERILPRIDTRRIIVYGHTFPSGAGPDLVASGIANTDIREGKLVACISDPDELLLAGRFESLREMVGEMPLELIEDRAWLGLLRAMLRENDPNRWPKGAEARTLLQKAQRKAKDAWSWGILAEGWKKLSDDEAAARRCLTKASDKAVGSAEWCYCAVSWQLLLTDESESRRCLKQAEAAADAPGAWISCAKTWGRLFSDATEARRCLTKASAKAGDSTDWCWCAVAWQELLIEESEARRCLKQAEAAPDGTSDWITCAKAWIELFDANSEARRCLKEAESEADGDSDWIDCARAWIHAHNNTTNAMRCLEKAERFEKKDESEAPFHWKKCADAWKNLLEEDVESDRCLESIENINTSYITKVSFAESLIEWGYKDRAIACLTRAEATMWAEGGVLTGFAIRLFTEKYMKCGEESRARSFVAKMEKEAKLISEWSDLAKIWKEVLNDITEARRCLKRAEKVVEEGGFAIAPNDWKRCADAWKAILEDEEESSRCLLRAGGPSEFESRMARAASETEATLRAIRNDPCLPLRGRDLFGSTQITRAEAALGCFRQVLAFEVSAMDGQMVRLPAGLDDGGKVRISGGGRKGTPNGDLVVTVDVGRRCVSCDGTGRKLFLGKCPYCSGGQYRSDYISVDRDK